MMGKSAFLSEGTAGQMKSAPCFAKDDDSTLPKEPNGSKIGLGTKPIRGMSAMPQHGTAKNVKDPLLVSIVINNYNYSKYVGEAISSALAQTYEKVEVVVVDDGSTDESREVIDSFGSRITRVYQSNSGQASALNTGLEQCQGELVLFLDADDKLMPSCVEDVLRRWHSRLSKLHFPLMIIDENGVPTGAVEPERALPEGNLADLMVQRGGYLSPPASGNVYARTYLKQVMPIPEVDWRICADCYLFNLAPFYGDIGAASIPLGQYRVHGDNHSVLVVDSSLRIDAVRKDALVDYQVRRIVQTHLNPNVQELEILEERSYHKLRTRLISKKLASKAHPFSGDTVAGLTRRCIFQVWRSDEITLRRKVLFTAWVTAIAILPPNLAEKVIVPAFKVRAHKTMARTASHSAS